MNIFNFPPFAQHNTVQHVLNANTPVHTIPDRVRHFAMNDASACLTVHPHRPTQISGLRQNNKTASTAVTAHKRFVFVQLGFGMRADASLFSK